MSPTHPLSQHPNARPGPSIHLDPSSTPIPHESDTPRSTPRDPLGSRNPPPTLANRHHSRGALLDDPGFANFDHFAPSYAQPSQYAHQPIDPEPLPQQPQYARLGSPEPPPPSALPPQQPQYAHFASPASPDYSSKPSSPPAQGGRYQTYNDFGQTPMSQAYAAREDPAAAAAAGGRSKRKKLLSLEFISSKWPRVFFGLVSAQAVICLAFEAYVHPSCPGSQIALGTD